MHTSKPVRFKPQRVVLEAILTERTERKSNCTFHTQTRGNMFKNALFTQKTRKLLATQVSPSFKSKQVTSYQKQSFKMHLELTKLNGTKMLISKCKVQRCYNNAIFHSTQQITKM